MNIPVSARSRRQAGFALIMVLILIGVSLLMLSGALYRSQTVSKINQRNIEYNTCANAAEAAVEKVYANIAFDFQSSGYGTVAGKLTSYQAMVPNGTENSYWNNFVFSDGQGNVGKTYVAQVSTYGGSLPSAYQGLYCASNSPIYRIISNVQRTNGNVVVTGTAQEDVLLALVPLNTWAIFYNGLLEFSYCATMIVNGRVQANGAIYVGTSQSLTFNSGVSTTATLTAPFVDGQSSSWTTNNASTWNTTFNSAPPYSQYVASVNVSLNMTNSHFLIDIPPALETPTSTIGAQRLYNQAQVVLIVTNAPSGIGNPVVQFTIQASANGTVPGNDSYKTVLYYTNASPVFLSTNLPFLSLTNLAYDQREYKTNLFTQIDVGRFSTWAATNSAIQSKLPPASSLYPTIFYVADRRNNTSSQLSSVRLVNGAQLPGNNGLGFTVATPNPLYVLGNYNVQTASSAANASFGTNTAATVPAALMSDSLTVLSSHWTDAASFSTYATGNTAYDAASDTINAAIVTGTMPSTGTSATTFSGGVHNLSRFLEDWTGSTLYLNTSILRLWDSQMATNQFRNPAGFTPSPVNPYYNPPTRKFSFDPNFLDPTKVPPGIPVALVPIRFGWGVPPPNSITYTPAYN